MENKAHYCDITGEVQFILNTRDEFDDAAKAAGVRIVHSCGFDSVPSEVITLQAAHYMMTNYGKKLGEVTGKLMDAGAHSLTQFWAHFSRFSATFTAWNCSICAMGCFKALLNVGIFGNIV